jgi:hypothetical protein
MKSNSILAVTLLAGALGLAGCAWEKSVTISERREETEMSRGPHWTLTPPPPANGEVFFVGRSIGVNILDEKKPINQAIDDAAYQIARAIGANVTGQVRIIDSRSGEEIKGTEKTDQTSRDEVVVDVKALISGMTQKDTYRELWQVREPDMAKPVRRYKYWVLISFPEAELKRLQDGVKKKQMMP